MYRKYREEVLSLHQASISPCHSSMSMKADGETPPVEVERQVGEMWKVIEQQILASQALPAQPATKPAPGAWKTVRIFVSSTFTDFFSEREILVKRVFPELREWCRNRKLQLIECDLRWGVPKDSTTGETILICMEELDRCFETNDGQPFFINMMGERYGWVPGPESLPAELMDRYQWVSGSSITLMEILHGAYRSQNPNAFFFLRNPALTDDIPEKFLNRFKDSDSLSIANLQVLKEKLRRRFPSQVIDYTAKVGEVQTTTGRELLEIAGLEDFASSVLESLKSSIEKVYPSSRDTSESSEMDREMEEQWLYACELAEVMLGREVELQQLLAYAGRQPHNLPVQGEEGDEAEGTDQTEGKEEAERSEAGRKLVLEARSGWGKSSLLASLVLHVSKTMPEVSVFYHFCGATPQSWQSRHLLQRLVSHLVTDSSVEELQTVREGTMQDVKALLEKALASVDQPTLLIIDAVNELDLCEDATHLSWLPSVLPAKVRCVVSTSEHEATQRRLKQAPAFWLSLRDLDTASLKDLAVLYLGKYSKKLDKEQLDVLMSQTRVNSPLWMSLMCEELRVFGDFRGISSFISGLPDNQDAFLSLVLHRLLTEDDTGCTRKVLCLLVTSLGGLPMPWLLEMLGDAGTREAVPLLHWARARRHLAPYLRFVGHPNTFLVFKHQSIYKAMEKILQENEEGFRPWHRHLADFYEFWCNDARLRASNLPYHLSSAGQGQRLIDFIQKDNDAGLISAHQRSMYLQKYRCKFMTTSSQGLPVRLCFKCSNSESTHNRWPRRDCCLLCGEYCFPASHRKLQPAVLCTQHSVAAGHGMRCHLCDDHMPPLPPRGRFPAAHFTETVGQLCQFCGFGHFGKVCVALSWF